MASRGSDLAVNISTAEPGWVNTLSQIGQEIAPIGKLSLFHVCLIKNNLTSLRLAYYGNEKTRCGTNNSDVDNPPNLQSEGKPNTPAYEYWTFYLIYTLQNDTFAAENWVPISFLPTGDIDNDRTTSGNLSIAATLLEPVTEILRIRDPTMDIWKLRSWFFTCYYWLLLADFGQVSPTIYPYSRNAFFGGPLPSPDLTVAPTGYSSNYNIFTNATLFQLYYSYLRDILPILTTLELPPFNPVNNTNWLEPEDVTFQRTYSCLARQWKGAIAAIISIFAANYTLFFGVYSIVIWGGLCTRS